MKPKVICLVPSLTETLIACDIELVGRSRFCIHPEAAVKKIAKVGGTKDIDWARCAELNPDLVILDKEENTLEMANSCPFDYIAVHIVNVESVATELFRLADALGSQPLKAVAERWQQVAEQPAKPRALADTPGILEWWHTPKKETDMEYLIWRDPWMAIGDNTFIASMLEHVGLAKFRRPHSQKYPTIDIQQLSPEETFMFYSSEPYPFAKRKVELESTGFRGALIDGECYSWYGIRSLEFLEEVKGTR